MSDDFKRQQSHKKKGTPDSWRKPVGTHSNVRKQKKGAAPKPKAGYRTRKDQRGIHPSGYREVIVHNISELEEIGEEEAARIASSVGTKKREKILEKAEEEDLKVLNPGETE